MSYLDKTGLGRFWEKVKERIAAVSVKADQALAKAGEGYDLAASHQTDIGTMQDYITPYLYVTSLRKDAPLGTLKDHVHLRSNDLIDGFGLSNCPLDIFGNLVTGHAVVRAWMVQQSGGEYRVSNLTPVFQYSQNSGQITFKEVTTGMSSAEKASVRSVCVEIVPSLLMYEYDYDS